MRRHLLSVGLFTLILIMAPGVFSRNVREITRVEITQPPGMARQLTEGNWDITMPCDAVITLKVTGVRAVGHTAALGLYDDDDWFRDGDDHLGTEEAPWGAGGEPFEMEFIIRCVGCIVTGAFAFMSSGETCAELYFKDGSTRWPEDDEFDVECVEGLARHVWSSGGYYTMTGFEMDIPEGALEDSNWIEARTTFPIPCPNLTDVNRYIEKAYSVSPVDVDLLTPVTMTFNLDGLTGEPDYMDQMRMLPQVFDPQDCAWYPISEFTRDTTLKTISIQVDSFGTYGISEPKTIELVIEKVHDAIQGVHQSVDVDMVSGVPPIGGFDFLIAYDASALALQSADPGPALYDPAPDGCGWEYFTYRHGPFGNCDDACPSGMVRVFGLAETNNGPNHPSCFLPDSLPATLFTLDYLVSNDRTLECQYVPIKFFWADCGDNSVSSMDGEVLYVSDHVYEFEGTDITDSTYGFPTYFGFQTECLANVDPDKPVPEPGIEFYNGGIDIVCADSIDDRGDINLNGVVNEVADAVLYSNYFVHGISVFNVNIDGQIAASDVNADGITLSVADLVYMIRIITGDAPPYPKLTPVAANAELVNGVLSVDTDMGAAYVVVERSITPKLLAESMGMKYQYDADHDLTRILVYSMDKDQRFADDFLGGIDGNVITLEMATYEGTPVMTKLVPDEFALYPSFPNPFNPVTTISFALASLVDYKLVIYNSLGQTVKTFNGHSGPGLERIDWNASGFASGVYFYRLTAGDFTDTKKMVLLK